MATPAAAEPRHGIAMHGAPKHAADMRAFPYVDPDAPKGGRLTLGVLGSFDSLNPLTFKGESAGGIRGYVYESLLTRADDEPFTLYGLLAETVDIPDDRSSITFKLRDGARFSDNRPVTTDDVLFSHRLLMEKGWPAQRTFYRKVERTEKHDARRVTFVFKREPDGSIDREMPLIMGLMAIVPAHAVDPATFEQTTLAPPVGSGPYRVTRVDAGRSLVFTRNPDWWARDLAVTRGRFNFDEIRHEYFRDAATLFEAFKAGELDALVDTDPGRWATGYDFPALRDGRIVRREFASRLPAGMSALVFNVRRAPFDDERVRAALTELFDAEWINRNLYGGLYRRTQSFFERSHLSSFTRPADERERRLLAPFPAAVPPAIMDGSFKLPVTDGSGNNRANQQRAARLLTEAGYAFEGRKLVRKATGKPFTFEVLANSRSQERLMLTYARALEPLGVTLQLRLVDSAQYEARLKESNFDMIQTFWASSLSPGNEQSIRWGTAAADQIGARNYAGIKSPAVDAMIAAVLSAREAEDFTSAVRALDRTLRAGSYVIPLFHLPHVWLAHWSHLAGPETLPNAGVDLDTWWAKGPKRLE